MRPLTVFYLQNLSRYEAFKLWESGKIYYLKTNLSKQFYQNNVF